ncbi:follistatin-A-like isoform X2 [Mytilus californianus]|uniref:follistatin-A-like isoform X2 n=1 Tax=Mytilus californianus TaxID=6549 RepID=UPI0022479FA9|nr:follistatin-A-like isoform X2 [Mytilus californianus]
MNEEMREKISDFIWIWIFILQPIVEGGICWQSISKTGNCRKMLMINVTKEQCCSLQTEPSVGWSPQSNPSSGLIFFWEYLSSKGAPVCRKCHNSCKDVICPKDKKCRMKNGIPKCVCKPKCSSIERSKGPVCGTDMTKYKSRCHLLRYNCRYNTDIKIDYYGKCKDSCQFVKCPGGRFCVEDQNGLPHCIVCSTDCSLAHKEPVCGNNLQTYESACHLRAEFCRTGNPLQIAYPGPCKEKRHGCKGCKRHLKRLLRRRRKQRRKKGHHKKHKKVSHFKQFKSKIYGGYTIFPNMMVTTEKYKLDSYKEFG